jgi:hypothetical protein
MHSVAEARLRSVASVVGVAATAMPLSGAAEIQTG